MIRSIRLKNFKCFKEFENEFGQLTVLTGTNGSGKSSVIQSLLLMDQSFKSGNAKAVLNGPMVSLGNASDILSSDATDDEITVDIESDQGFCTLWIKCEPGIQKALNSKLQVEKGGIGTLDYVSADRFGPRTSLPISDEGLDVARVGNRGEYVAHFLAVNGDRPMRNSSAPRHHSALSSATLSTQVVAYMTDISPGVRITANTIADSDISSVRYGFEVEHDVTPSYRASNVGFGISYSLPIVVSLLSAKPGATVIIENPEAHLHPRGQTAIGDMVARVAASGVQVIIETHSDHVVDAIRIAAKRKVLDPDQTAIYFFQRDGAYSPVVKKPVLNSEGRLSEWPDGFFDQISINLARIGGVELD